MKCTFIVPGKPVPKGRPRVTRHGTYTPKSTQAFEAAVRQAWQEAGAVQFPAGAPLDILVSAYFPIPQSASKKRRAELSGAYHTAARGDLDNIVKAVMDALNGCAYPDDSAVCRIFAEKYYSDTPRTFVSVSTADGPF